MIAFQFPGQSSWSTSMGHRAETAFPEAFRAIAEVADDVLGINLRSALSDGMFFANNRGVQLGVFLTTMVHLRALESAGVSAEVSLGLSLGEYSHLVHIGALGLPDAVRLVAARGALYDHGPSGSMAAVFPLETSVLEPLLAQFPALAVTNYNSPTQHVVAGPVEAVERLAVHLEEEHFTECRFIERRIPMHHVSFQSVGDAFSLILARTPFGQARIAYRPNVTADVIEGAIPDDIRLLLRRHVSEPVLWRRSIERLAADPDVTFVEVGPGNALTGLLSRRWVKNERFFTDTPDPAEAVAKLATGLG